MNAQNARRDLNHVSEIVAESYALPMGVVDNEEYLARCRFSLGTDPATLALETRMTTRRWCLPHENTRTLVESAVERLLATHPDVCREIDLVVVASGTTMTMAHPSDPENRAFADLSPLVIEQLGGTRTLGMDIKACYCTGFLRALQTADALLANPNYRHALVIAAEQGSRFATASTNRSTFCYIVADAAGAVVLRRSAPRAAAGVIDYCGYTDATKRRWVGIGEDAASMVMLGSRAAQATKEMLVACGRELLARNRLTPAQIDWFVPIQTHSGLLDEVCRALELPRDKMLWRGDVNGFSGSASIPSCLAEHRDVGVLRRGQLVLSLAVGAGMNCAGSLYYA